MDEQNGYSGFRPTAYGTLEVATTRVAVKDVAPVLRPLSTGEILDRVFVLYRSHFWLFVAIGMLPAAVVTASSAARMIVAVTRGVGTVVPATGPEAIARMLNATASTQVYFLPATVLFVVAYGLSHAATVYAVGRLSRGQPSSAGEAYRATRGRWLRWTGIAMRLFWSLLWPVLPVALVLAGALAMPGVSGNAAMVSILSILFVVLLPLALVFGVINLLRNALGMPAGVEEDLRVGTAMRRSKALVAGRKGRIFLTLLLVYALQLVAGGLQVPFVLMATMSRGAQHVILQAAELLISFVATALVSPVASIALTLLYVDERVRREGFDIELLMQQSLPPDASTTTAQNETPSQVWNA